MSCLRFLRPTLTLTALALLGSLQSTLSAQGERVPEPAVVAGKPQGIFVGRSLLTGRAVCLMFLSDGRVTRFIPLGGLEQFDWSRHQAVHHGDSGMWEMSGGQLRITWGDGGVHQGPLTIRPGGIEFYGKRYGTPGTAKVTALVGRWESARGTAIAGGSGINITNSFSVESDGRYLWTAGTGGVVGGRATATDASRAGMLRISGQTIIFEANDGTRSAHTFLPVPGEPLGAFSIDLDLFTRMVLPTSIPPSPKCAYTRWQIAEGQTRNSRGGSGTATLNLLQDRPNAVHRGNDSSTPGLEP